MPQILTQRTGNIHFALYIPDDLPPIPPSGDFFETQIAWIRSYSELPSNTFAHLPLDPTPPRALDVGALRATDLWRTEAQSVRYTTLALKTTGEPMTETKTYRVVAHRMLLSDAASGATEIEALRQSLAGLVTQDDEAEALCRETAELDTQDE